MREGQGRDTQGRRAGHWRREGAPPAACPNQTFLAPRHGGLLVFYRLVLQMPDSPESDSVKLSCLVATGLSVPRRRREQGEGPI